jgi:hypothetical protein
LLESLFVSCPTSSELAVNALLPEHPHDAHACQENAYPRQQIGRVGYRLGGGAAGGDRFQSCHPRLQVADALLQSVVFGCQFLVLGIQALDSG